MILPVICYLIEILLYYSSTGMGAAGNRNMGITNENENGME